MNKLLILLIFIIFINSSFGFEFRQLVYTNQNCKDYPKFVYSSTQCSPNGYISITNKTFVSLGPTSEVLCKQSNNITSAPSKLLQINSCIKSSNGINSYMYLVNQFGTPISVNGYCTTYTYYNDQSCSNLLVYSYSNGSCIYSSKLSQYRKLVCTQTEQLTYNCGDDSTCSTCTPSSGDSGKIPDNVCKIKDINLSDVDSISSSSKSYGSNILLFSVLIFIIFYI